MLKKYLFESIEIMQAVKVVTGFHKYRLSKGINFVSNTNQVLVNQVKPQKYHQQNFEFQVEHYLQKIIKLFAQNDSSGHQCHPGFTTLLIQLINCLLS